MKKIVFGSEGRAVSGTAVYATTFDLSEKEADRTITLDLGRADMIAIISVNGTSFRPLWAGPYRIDITDAVRSGKNTFCVEVTSTWFNRLGYDAGQPVEKRKTWTLNNPWNPDSPLQKSGLLNPVILEKIAR